MVHINNLYCNKKGYKHNQLKNKYYNKLTIKKCKKKILIQLIFCMMATLMVHPRIMKIHKNIPGDIANIFPYQHFIPSLRNCIHKSFLYGSHPNGTP